MDDVFKERIRLIRGDLTYEQFANELTKSGLPFGKALVWRYENEKDLHPGFAFFYAVAKVFQINLNWLITGDGAVKITVTNDKSIEEAPIVPKLTSNSSKTRLTRQLKVSKAKRK